MSQEITKYPITKAVIVATRVSPIEKAFKGLDIEFINSKAPLPSTAGIASRNE
jgi:hypothetical protein